MTATADRKWERSGAKPAEAGKRDRPDDEITLTVYTLRRMLRHAAPLVIVETATPVADIARAIRASAAGAAVIVIVVDDSRALYGTLSRSQLARAIADGATGVAAYCSCAPVVLDPEDDLDDAAAAIAAGQVDHVLVATAAGTLLGALSAADIRRARTRA